MTVDVYAQYRGRAFGEGVFHPDFFDLSKNAGYDEERVSDIVQGIKLIHDRFIPNDMDNDSTQINEYEVRYNDHSGRQSTRESEALYKYFKDWVAMVIYPESQPKLVPVQHKLGRYTTQEFLYFTQRGQSPNIYPRVRGRIKDARSNGQKFDRFTGSYHAPPTYLTTAEKLIEESLAKLRNSKVKIAN